jgi:hypothetical protein
MLLPCIATPVSAQDLRIDGEDAPTNLSYFVFAQPGDVTIKVWVWGGVTGVYEIRNDLDIGELFTLTGVASLDKNDQTNRLTTVRLYRDDTGQRRIVYESTVEQMITETNYPLLRDGDVISIDTLTDRKFNWRDIVQILQIVGTLYLIGDRIFGGN